MLTLHRFRQLRLVVTEVFTRGDVFHLWSNNALTRIVQLSYILARLGLAGRTLALHAPVGVAQVLLTTNGEVRLGLIQFDGVITTANPVFTHRSQTLVEVNLHVWIGVRPRCVIDTHRQIVFCSAVRLLGWRQGNLTLTNGQIQRLLTLGTVQIHVLLAGRLIAQTLQVSLRQR